MEALRGKRVTRVSAGMHHTMVMLDNGDVYSWGSGEYGRLGHDDEQMQTTPVLSLPPPSRSTHFSRTPCIVAQLHADKAAERLEPNGRASAHYPKFS